MRTYRPNDRFYFCGHWNGSPVEIGLMPEPLKNVPPSEDMHYHDYYEYYVVLEGKAELVVEGETVPLTGGTVVMVEPGERHRVVFVDPDIGARWVIVKQQSAPDSKHVVPESA